MRLYVKSRRLELMAALVVILGMFAWIAGERKVALSLTEDPATMPLRAILHMFLAIVLVVSMQSSTPLLDRMDTGVLKMIQWLHLLLGVIAGVTIAYVTSYATELGDGSVMARAYVGCLGLALLSGAVLRSEGLAWVLPIIGLGITATVLSRPTLEHWSWMLYEEQSKESWVLAAGFFVLGVSARVLKKLQPLH